LPCALQTLAGLISQALPGTSNVSSALPLWGLGGTGALNATLTAVLMTQIDSCTLVLPASDYATLLAFALLQQGGSAPGCITPADLVAPTPASALVLMSGTGSTGCLLLLLQLPAGCS
jgi:hypothetical protein